MISAHCHCSVWRRAHGATFATWFTAPKHHPRPEQGEAELGRYRSPDHTTRAFGKPCGRPLLFETSRPPEQLDVFLARMEAPIDRRSQLHVHFDDRVERVELGDSLLRLGAASGLERL